MLVMMEQLLLIPLNLKKSNSCMLVQLSLSAGRVHGRCCLDGEAMLMLVLELFGNFEGNCNCYR